MDHHHYISILWACDACDPFETVQDRNFPIFRLIQTSLKTFIVQLLRCR